MKKCYRAKSVTVNEDIMKFKAVFFCLGTGKMKLKVESSGLQPNTVDKGIMFLGHQ